MPVTGSIPACAGEPPEPAVTGLQLGLSPRVRGNIQPMLPPAQLKVYPRVCGGTICAGSLGPLATGLSPRVRGNPDKEYVSAVGVGSIPACAGEPRTPWTPLRREPVYPRVCGGTSR